MSAKCGIWYLQSSRIRCITKRKTLGVAPELEGWRLIASQPQIRRNIDQNLVARISLQIVLLNWLLSFDLTCFDFSMIFPMFFMLKQFPAVSATSSLAHLHVFVALLQQVREVEVLRFILQMFCDFRDLVICCAAPSCSFVVASDLLFVFRYFLILPYFCSVFVLMFLLPSINICIYKSWQMQSKIQFRQTETTIPALNIVHINYTNQSWLENTWKQQATLMTRCQYCPFHLLTCVCSLELFLALCWLSLALSSILI